MYDIALLNGCCFSKLHWNHSQPQHIISEVCNPIVQ